MARERLHIDYEVSAPDADRDYWAVVGVFTQGATFAVPGDRFVAFVGDTEAECRDLIARAKVGA